MAKKRVKIIPSILSKNKAEFTKHWKKISPYFVYTQIDIMDGKFVRIKNSIINRPSIHGFHVMWDSF